MGCLRSGKILGSSVNQHDWHALASEQLAGHATEHEFHRLGMPIAADDKEVRIATHGEGLQGASRVAPVGIDYMDLDMVTMAAKMAGYVGSRNYLTSLGTRGCIDDDHVDIRFGFGKGEHGPCRS